MQLYPAILTGNVDVLREQLEVLTNQENVPAVHIDVIDGIFADNLTITPIDLSEVELEELQVDLHLMVSEPLDFVFETLTSIDKSNVRAIIGQIEQMSWQGEFLTEVTKHGWKAGLALDIFTPLEEIEAASWSQIDVIQLMAIEAGQMGQTFNPLVFEKLAELKEKLKNNHKAVEIIVDGGVKGALFPRLAQAGVQSVAMASEIWTASDPADKLSELLNVAETV